MDCGLYPGNGEWSTIVDKPADSYLYVSHTSTPGATDYYRLTDKGGCTVTHLAFPYGFDAEGRSARVAYGSDEHLKDMLELLILTLLGERVMRPELGSPVLQLVFAGGEGPKALALKSSLEAAISQWLGHVLRLDSLTASFLEADAVLEIVVHYKSRQTGQSGELALKKALT
jgi:hypothetical protein